MEFDKLIEIAKDTLYPIKHTEFCESGGVACALVTDKGNVYTGVCIDVACSMGFCAEHAAIANMITNRETRIDKIVAIGWNHRVYPPCGRCREFISQIHLENNSAKVLVGGNKVVTLSELLPYDWKNVCLEEKISE